MLKIAKDFREIFYTLSQITFLNGNATLFRLHIDGEIEQRCLHARNTIEN